MIDDDLWLAIGDPTRRHLIDQLLENGSGTASSLSDDLPVTRQAVSKHLVVLERADLVRSSAVGRERIYQPDHEQLARAAAQLAAVGSSWDGRLRRIARIAEDIERAKRKKSKPDQRTTPEKKDAP